MKTFFKSIVLTFACLLTLFLFSKLADASEVFRLIDDIKLVEIKDLYIEFKQFTPDSRNPMITNNGIPNRIMDKEINLHLDMDILRYLYFENMIHSMTDAPIDGGCGQFKVIGWNFRVGIHIWKYIDLQFEHYSQHSLDNVLPFNFPMENSIGVKIYIYRKNWNNNIVDDTYGLIKNIFERN